MLTIYKYEITPDTKSLPLPAEAQILSFQLQGGKPCIWVKLDPVAPTILRHFHLAGTGHELPPEIHDANFIGTVQLYHGALVFHLFELKKK